MKIYMNGVGSVMGMAYQYANKMQKTSAGQPLHNRMLNSETNFYFGGQSQAAAVTAYGSAIRTFATV